MICFNASDLISLKANNGLLQPRLQDDDDDDDDDEVLSTSWIAIAQLLQTTDSPTAVQA